MTLLVGHIRAALLLVLIQFSDSKHLWLKIDDTSLNGTIEGRNLSEKKQDSQAIRGRSIDQFASMNIKLLDPVCSTTSLRFGIQGYGCYCGLGPSLDKIKTNATMNGFDKLCNIHDWCYTANTKAGCTSFDDNFINSFHYDIREEDVSAFGGYGKKTVACNAVENDYCQQRVCQCDSNFINGIRALMTSTYSTTGKFNCLGSNPGCPYGIYT